jgi:uncharacterized protein (DUF1330 family)
MSVYAIFVRDRMIDPEEFKIYTQKSGQARANHPLKAHVYYGAVEVMEGPPVDGAVVVEFPTMAAAHAWYESPEYQAAKVHRRKAADYRVFFVEGLPQV